jgi:hypothetical protein
MDLSEAVIKSSASRNPVKDFSRRNFVVFYILLVAIPTIYFISYVLGVQDGSQPPPPVHIHLPTQSLADSPSLQNIDFFNVVKACWNAAPKLIPYAIGQYLLGLESDLNQPFVWANGSLLALMLLTLTGVFDIFVNPELKNVGKFLWSIALIVGSAFGAPIPLLVYWYLYMFLEPSKIKAETI